MSTKREMRRRGEQLIKIATVYLRDEAKLPFGEVVHALSYCWTHTETEEAARRRSTA